MKDILIGKADIKTLLEGNYIYVDKTEYIYNLIRIPDCYFLSRPRRFGKSLLVSTLFEIFSGNKELFKECWIYKNTNYDWKSYPILYLDFSSKKEDTQKNFYTILIEQLQYVALNYDIELKEKSHATSIFYELVNKLYEKKGKIVFLVDEYDKPLLDNIDNLDKAKENREILKGLFSSAKSLSSMLRFQFVTGITKFSQTSLFSGPNNLFDISMNKKYSCLLGYTQEELLFYFNDYLILASRSADINLSIENLLIKIKQYYNGYLFTESLDNKETVYNPFSILKFFKNTKFGNYWFNSATPTYLVKLLSQYFYDVPEDENNINLKMSELEKFEIDSINLLSLLVQAGYLTIEGYNFEKRELKLRYPNEEVRISFLEQIQDIIILKKKIKEIKSNLNLYLKNQDWSNLFELFKTLYASIPYTVKRNESWYASMFFQAFQANGFRCEMEGMTNIGRTDMMLYDNNTIYIIEFKYNKTAQEAIDQIKNNLYYEKYLTENSPIIFIGINFSEFKKNINDWKVEEYK